MNFKIGDRIFVRGYIDEIRKDTVIVRNDGGYFGTILSEVTGELSSAQPNLDEWCTDCKEYDHEKHCCPRFNRVIRDTLNEVEPMRKRGTWMHDKDDVLISGYCSCCGWESIIMETDVADMPFCPNCGADMRGEGS